jgi:hypothetical protein
VFCLRKLTLAERLYFGLVFFSGLGQLPSPDNMYLEVYKMRRFVVFVFCLGIVATVMAGSAWAIAPLSGQKPLTGPSQSLIIQAKAMTDLQKCKALNRCRYKYTRCYNKLVRDHKNIEETKIECVKPYQKCINATFSGFDFFFTRWFNPNVDCSQY